MRRRCRTMQAAGGLGPSTGRLTWRPEPTGALVVSVAVAWRALRRSARSLSPARRALAVVAFVSLAQAAVWLTTGDWRNAAGAAVSATAGDGFVPVGSRGRRGAQSRHLGGAYRAVRRRAALLPVPRLNPCGTLGAQATFSPGTRVSPYQPSHTRERYRHGPGQRRRPPLDAPQEPRAPLGLGSSCWSVDYPVVAQRPRSARSGPSVEGRMSKSKIAVGRYSVAHGLGTSTTPLKRPSIGAAPSSR
jgi:hypothetical protein